LAPPPDRSRSLIWEARRQARTHSTSTNLKPGRRPARRSYRGVSLRWSLRGYLRCCRRQYSRVEAFRSLPQHRTGRRQRRRFLNGIGTELTTCPPLHTILSL
jgi:hypothetical protein